MKWALTRLTSSCRSGRCRLCSPWRKATRIVIFISHFQFPKEGSRHIKNKSSMLAFLLFFVSQVYSIVSQALMIQKLKTMTHRLNNTRVCRVDTRNVVVSNQTKTIRKARTCHNLILDCGESIKAVSSSEDPLRGNDWAAAEVGDALLAGQCHCLFLVLLDKQNQIQSK